MNLTLDRSYIPNDSCVLGRMCSEDGKHSFHTLENPWKDNARSVSCIPEGTYKLRKRASPLIQRLSKGLFQEGWEVVDVEGRTFIMIHQGNYVRQTDGCILVGEAYSHNAGEGFMVTHSVRAFAEFMKALDQDDEHTLTIKAYSPTSSKQLVEKDDKEGDCIGYLKKALKCLLSNSKS